VEGCKVEIYLVFWSKPMWTHIPAGYVPEAEMNPTMHFLGPARFLCSGRVAIANFQPTTLKAPASSDSSGVFVIPSLTSIENILQQISQDGYR